MGRESVQRDARITIRLTSGQKRNIKYCAKRLGMSQTEVLCQGVELIRQIIEKRDAKDRE